MENLEKVAEHACNTCWFVKKHKAVFDMETDTLKINITVEALRSNEEVSELLSLTRKIKSKMPKEVKVQFNVKYTI